MQLSDLADWWNQIFTFTNYGELLALLHNSILAGPVLGITGGLIGVFVMARAMPFAVHGISELSFAGAAAGLLLGVGVVAGSLIGSIIAALLIGALGSRARDRNSITAVLMPFGLGLGILCLALYSGRSANKFGLLTGQIVAIDNPQIGALILICTLVCAGLLVIWRPLLFASVDPAVAAGRGVPTRALSILFMLLLGMTVAVAVQIVGALLVLSLLVTPPPQPSVSPPHRWWYRCSASSSPSPPASAASSSPSAAPSRSAPTSPPSPSSSTSAAGSSARAGRAAMSAGARRVLHRPQWHGDTPLGYHDGRACGRQWGASAG